MGKAVNYDVAGYADFQRRASDPSLTGNERAGFPDALRCGRSSAILSDIDAKIPAFAKEESRVLDIGIGCSDLSLEIVMRSVARKQKLTVIDAPEVLAHLPDHANITKLPGPFPECLRLVDPIGPFDAILAYSVAQYVFAEGNLHRFVDEATLLLDELAGGFLLGDIPNVDMRKRLFSSSAGRAYHDTNYPGLPQPEARFNTPELGSIDDAVVIALVSRARAAGFQAFVLPQGDMLPMANRREDILIRRY